MGEQEIKNLFLQQDDNNVVVKEQINEIPRESYYGVGFFIKNVDKSSGIPFRYALSVFDMQDCDITEEQAMSYIITQDSATINIAKEGTYSDVIEFKIPKNAPACSLKYKIAVDNLGTFYDSTVFTVRIKEAPLFRAVFC